jgi:hypothetical protein
LIDDFSKLKTDYDRLSLAIEFVRWVSIVSREGDSHREVFNLLGHALKAAETTSTLNLLKVQFQLKFMHLQGMLPPEDRYLPFTRVSIRDHASLAQRFPEWRSLQTEAQNLLDAYIQI